MSEAKSNVDESAVERLVISREQAIETFFRAIDHDDPYWTDLVEDLCVYDDDDEIVNWPSQWDMGRALGFTDEEMEIATSAEKGRLKELGL